MMKLKWHKEIKAWADGAEIEAYQRGEWYGTKFPCWDSTIEYRIKPQDICKCQKQACPALKEVNDNVYKIAEQCNGDLTTFDGEPLCYTFALANLEKFAQAVIDAYVEKQRTASGACKAHRS